MCCLEYRSVQTTLQFLSWVFSNVFDDDQFSTEIQIPAERNMTMNRLKFLPKRINSVMIQIKA